MNMNGLVSKNKSHQSGNRTKGRGEVNQYENQMTTFPEILKVRVLELLNDELYRREMFDFNDRVDEDSRIVTVFLYNNLVESFEIVKYFHFNYGPDDFSESVRVYKIYPDELELINKCHKSKKKKQSV